jgi:L-asparaginase
MKELPEKDHLEYCIESKRVLMLLTGGTAGMRRDPEHKSLVPGKGYLAESLQTMMSDSRSTYKYPKVVVCEYPTQLDSSDMGPPEWERIAKDIENQYDKFDGFVVVMGTDTLSYCACALSFMLENLSKTVVVTGAMLPIERGESDARRNLMISIVVAAVSKIPEVVVCFRDAVYRGNRTKKIDSESLNAFASPNFPPLAIAGTELIVQRALVRNPPTPDHKFTLRTQMDGNIVAMRLIPGFRADAIRLLTNVAGLKGMILELYGAGNAPKNLDLIHSVKSAVERGVVVMIVSQCHRGLVDIQAYSSGRQMLEAGAVSAGDMTFEACAVKMAFLFGQGLSPNEVREQMKLGMRGEMSLASKSEARFMDCIVVKDVAHLVAHM